jgi:single-stranded DNA-binding protein
MNHCSFFGRCSDIHYTSENIEKIEIVLQVENKRKGKNDVKKMDYEYLSFEAWGTAAITIFKNISPGDYMLIIDSTARSQSGITRFRINEFKILKKEH